MKKFIFIVGGARSGKSRFSVDLAKKISKKVLFIATLEPQDSEMKKRVALHKNSRPRSWKTIEERADIASILSKRRNSTDVVIIDCLGLLITNLLSDDQKDRSIENNIRSIAKAAKSADNTVIIVSNEVGGGIVPDNPLARRFRDLAGTANQVMSRHADTVYSMHAGIPVVIKKTP